MKNNSIKTDGKNIAQDDDKKQQVKSLDDLIELLDQDALRHVVGGRPKGKPTFA